MERKPQRTIREELFSALQFKIYMCHSVSWFVCHYVNSAKNTKNKNYSAYIKKKEGRNEHLKIIIQHSHVFGQWLLNM